MIKRTIFQLLLAIQSFVSMTRTHKIPHRFVHQNVPYFAQWESRELVGAILTGITRAKDDPKWRNSGATTKTEYSDWSWSGCGMACLKMILAHRNNVIVPLVELGKKCALYGGYDFPLQASVGLKYNPFAEFVRQEYGLDVKVITIMPIRQILQELAKGGYVIASVSPGIRNPHSLSVSRGGHLVLLLGYDNKRQELYLHNPSGGKPGSEEYAVVSFTDFKKFFSNRGVVVE